MKVPEEREDSRVGLIRVVGDDTVLVSVRTRQDWIPAQHVYLHIPSETIGGHPFTVCNISRPLTQADNERPYESTQELLIRVREGMTKQLFKVGSGVRDEQGVAEGWIGNEREGVPIKALPRDLVRVSSRRLLRSPQTATASTWARTTTLSSSSLGALEYPMPFPTLSI